MTVAATVFCLFPSYSGACAFDTLASVDTVFHRLAGPAGFDPGDFDLLVNFRGPPPQSPDAVLRMLHNPRSADTLVPALRHTLSETFDPPSDPTSGLTGMVRADGLWPWIGATFPRSRTAQDGSPESRIRILEKSLQAYLRPLDLDQRAFLLRETPALFRPETEDTLLNPIEREISRVHGDATLDSVMHLAQRLPLEQLAQAAAAVDGLLGDLLSYQTKNGGKRKGNKAGINPKIDIAAVTARLQQLKKLGVPVTIGTRGPDVHRLENGIVFDPGGNDRYVYADTVVPGSWLLVLDLSGKDTYQAPDTGEGAGAFLSVHVIADLQGDDRYIGGDFAFGSAILGFSRLFDAAGNDTYTGRCAALGFAFRGIGILQDRDGDDTYSAAYMSQGASSSFGFGLLMDESGNDRYLSRAVFVDDLRYREHYLSMSQGFSTGMAPRYGGGIAVLWDRGGADRYTADIFGQGAGYWFGWGALMDDAGDDSLVAHQYAQGAGVHFAVGMLLDAAGEDVRVSKGVSQGCGHDGGFGLFADAQGDDRDSAVDMSAGAGSANGLGMLVDFAGEDAYGMDNPAMTLGHGDMRRDRGSLGFFLDLGGRDAYPQSSAATENAVWRTYDGIRRGHGQGWDAE